MIDALFMIYVGLFAVLVFTLVVLSVKTVIYLSFLQRKESRKLVDEKRRKN